MSQVRTAVLADVPAVHALVQGAYRGDSARRGWTHEADLLDGQRTDAEALAAIIDDPSQALLLLQAQGRLLGCVKVSDLGEGRAELGMLAVAPDAQAGGIGRRLIGEAERHAAGRFDAAWMQMTVISVRDELIAWYQRRGYARTGEVAPFPMDDPRFGLPRRRDLAFAVLRKRLGEPAEPTGR